MNEDLRNSIDELAKELDEKKMVIEEFKINHDRIMTQMEAACREKNEISDMTTLYSNEYEKMKENYDYDMMKKEQ